MENVWDEIKELWLEVREYKWKCHDIPAQAQGKLSKLVKLYKSQHPKTYLSTSACKLAATITSIGTTLAGRGLVEKDKVWRR